MLLLYLVAIGFAEEAKIELALYTPETYLDAMSQPDIECAFIVFMSPICDAAIGAMTQLAVARNLISKSHILLAAVDITNGSLYNITASPTLLYFPMPSIPSIHTAYNGFLQASLLATYVLRAKQERKEYSTHDAFFELLKGGENKTLAFRAIAAIDDIAITGASPLDIQDKFITALSETCANRVDTVFVRKSRAEEKLWDAITTRIPSRKWHSRFSTPMTSDVHISMWRRDEVVSYWNSGDFQQWCLVNALELVPIFDSGHHYFGEDLGYDLILLHFSPWNSSHPEIAEKQSILEEEIAAERLRDSQFELVLPVVVPRDKLDLPILLDHWKLDSTAWTIGAFAPKTQRRYELQEESIWSFARNILDGRHPPIYRYDPDDTSIKCLENDSMERLVLLIMPWCAFCMHFISSAWISLKKVYANAAYCILRDVEHPMIPMVTDFPSLFFFPVAGTGYQYPWEEHSVEAVVRWIHEVKNNTDVLLHGVEL